MSDTTFSNSSTNDEGRASAQSRSRTRPRQRPQPQPQVEETYEEEYDEAGEDFEDYDEPVGLFSTPGRTAALVGAIVLLLAIGVGIAWQLGASSASSSNGTTAHLSSGPRTGLLAPQFNLVDVETNQPVSLQSLRGEPVWINFWGTWCPPCKAEMPEMEKLYQQYKGQVHMVGISMGPRDSVGDVNQFVKLNGYHWQFIHDPDSAVMNNYQVTGIPSSFFIDKNGVIRSIRVGGSTAPELEANLKIALNAQ